MMKMQMKMMNCIYPESGFDCFGNCIESLDECGVCGEPESHVRDVITQMNFER